MYFSPEEEFSFITCDTGACSGCSDTDTGIRCGSDHVLVTNHVTPATPLYSNVNLSSVQEEQCQQFGGVLGYEMMTKESRLLSLIGPEEAESSSFNKPFDKTPEEPTQRTVRRSSLMLAAGNNNQQLQLTLEK